MTQKQLTPVYISAIFLQLVTEGKQIESNFGYARYPLFGIH